MIYLKNGRALTGNDFTSVVNGLIIPEFYCDRFGILMIEITKERTKWLIVVYDFGKKFIQVKYDTVLFKKRMENLKQLLLI